MSLEHILGKLDSFEEFARNHHNTAGSFPLGNHQMVPVYDSVENGLWRFVLAYGTSAGKTAVPLEILNHLFQKGESPKVLVIAPKQTLLDNWGEEKLREHNLSMNIHHVQGQDSLIIPSSANFVTINYDKLSDSMGYLDSLIAYARGVDLVIPDEFQNVKNRNGKISGGYQQIINASKNSRFIGLSASPVYDKMKDAGVMLYSLDPVRFSHYKDIAFKVNEDPEAIWEMREKGMIRFFDRESVAKFHNLPEFTEGIPIPVLMLPKYEDAYMEAFESSFTLGKIHNLERIAIEALIHSPDTKDFLRDRIRQGHTINFFSHLIHAPEGGSRDEGIFDQLESMLTEVGAKDVATICGATSNDDRLKAQEKMANGELDALINQWNCTSEGFAEFAGDRPVTIVPLRSPYEPGRKLQIIGRSYRRGQHAPVDYQELHAHSNDLIQRIEDFVHAYAREHDVHIKPMWVPSLFHLDTHNILSGKERTIDLCLNQRSHGLFYKEEDQDISSAQQYAHSISKERTIDTRDRNEILPALKDCPWATFRFAKSGVSLIHLDHAVFFL